VRAPLVPRPAPRPTRAGRPWGPSPRSTTPVSPRSPRERFVSNDEYRASREWSRYEGTAQRELFRQLRERFLARHAPIARWALDAGSGPGRFTARVGAAGTQRRVALDIGREMLVQLLDRWPTGPGTSPAPDVVLADALMPPFGDHTFDLVAALGNLIGFAEAGGDRLLENLIAMVAPGGTLMLEVAPGPGEHSRYLRRLPPGSVRRLLRAPPRVVVARTDREGFAAEPSRKTTAGAFRRTEVADLLRTIESKGFRVVEVVAVAPALGSDPGRAAEVARDPKAWAHLLEIEESLGRSPERWGSAAAVLLSAIGPESNESGAAGAAPPKRRVK
jgi:SAM-dependent methyltransferase